MLESLTNDVKLGELVKIYLISGETLEGTLEEVSATSIILNVGDSRKRLFDNFIGGWDICVPRSTDDVQTDNQPVGRELEDSGSSQNQDTRISGVNDLCSMVLALEQSLTPEEREQEIAANAAVVKTNGKKANVRLYSNGEVLETGYYSFVNSQLLTDLKNSKLEIPVYVHLWNDKQKGRSKVNMVSYPGTVIDYIYILKEIVDKKRKYLLSRNVCYVIRDHLNTPKNIGMVYSLLTRLKDEYSDNAPISSPSLSTSKSELGISVRLTKDGIITSDNELNKRLALSPEQLINCKIIEADINDFSFKTPEILAENGKVTEEIAFNLLESAKETGNAIDFLESLKAFTSLPEDTYREIDYREAYTGYAFSKCKQLFGIYQKVVREAKTVSALSIENLGKTKDNLLAYYQEYLTLYLNDIDRVNIFLCDYLRVDISFALIKNYSALDDAKHILENDFVVFGELDVVENYHLQLSISFLKVLLQIPDIWPLLSSHKSDYQSVYGTLSDSDLEEFLKCCPKRVKKIVRENNDFLDLLVEWAPEGVLTNTRDLYQLLTLKFSPSALMAIDKKCTTVTKDRFTILRNDTDFISLEGIKSIVRNLKNYSRRSENERKMLVNNALVEIESLIKWNSDGTTKIGRYFFEPLLTIWKSSLEGLSTTKREKDCLLSLTLDPSFYSIQDGKKLITCVLTNTGDVTLEGFRLAVWSGENKSLAVVVSKTKELSPKMSYIETLVLPDDKWGNYESYELGFALGSKYLQKWSEDAFFRFTVSKQPTQKLDKRDLKWKEKGVPGDLLFKGRDEILETLSSHYLSEERYETYILYGMSRTGKSCILTYLGKKLIGQTIYKNETVFRVIPLYMDLSVPAGTVRTSEEFWKHILDSFQLQVDEYLTGKPMELDYVPRPHTDINSFLLYLRGEKLHPLIMFDEFSVMETLIDKDLIPAPFLHVLRRYAVDDDLASFIFAGTYDIKERLIHSEKYNIAGSFVYTIEMKIYNIDSLSAEQLINVMGEKLSFTEKAISGIHRLTGDVPYWIQKICLNCGFYAEKRHQSLIGIHDLESVVSILTGEKPSQGSYYSIRKMSQTVFDKTQTLPSDSKEIRLILSTIAYIIKNNPVALTGVTMEQIRDIWKAKELDDSLYPISDALDALVERQTLIREERYDKHYYYFSLDLFRRWWTVEHSDFDLELSSFRKVKQ